MRIKIGDQTHAYRRWDTHFLPAGIPPMTRVERGRPGLDVFEEHDRSLPRTD